MKKKVAVVILNWNGLKLMQRFMPQVIANSREARIVVADNGSTDDSLPWLRATYPEVDIIPFEENHGFAQGYNLALEKIEESLAVLLNSDVAPAEGWLSPLIDMMESDTTIVACQPKVLQVDDHSKFEYAGAAGGFLDRNGYPYCRGRILGCIETDTGQYDAPLEVDWVTGAAMMVRTDLYLKAGGLDSLFFAHMEEIDLCWRFRRMGYKLMAVPTSVVYHLGGGSLAMGSPRKTYLNFRNSLLMLYKNLPEKGRKVKLIKRRLLDTIAWGVNVITGRWSHAAAIFRAHRDYSHMVKKYSSTPSESTDNPLLPPESRIPKPDFLSQRPNIITRYYLRRHKTFSRL